MEREPRNLEELLEALECAEESDSRTVSVGQLFDAVGHRSFGPILLLAGLIGVSPLSGIPGVPTVIAIIVIATAGQLLMRRDHFWVPGWIERRTVKQSKFDKALKWLRPGARFIDRFIKPRLTRFATGPAVYAIAMVCVVVALTMPPLELLPFVGTAASTVLSAFGLALIARDGLLAMAGLVLFVGAAAVIGYTLLG